MKILFYFGHPAQYLFLRETIRRLESNGNQIKILIKSKDVLEDLLKNDSFDYVNILPSTRGDSKISIAFSLVQRIFLIFPILLKFKPDVLIGSDASIAQLGKLLNIPRITITEDDYEVIKSLGRLTYPFTKTILCPDVCKVGKYEYKKIGYAGYMKLGYLHPNVFTPDNKIVEKYHLPESFAIIRLSKLNAHHDFGITGINNQILDKLISIIENKSLQVFISSERPVDEGYKSYKLDINPSDMHHILATSSLIVSDSQSMSVEAAMLGIPSIRFNDFAGKISVLEELEHTYQLTFGINTNNEEKLFNTLNDLINNPDLRSEFQVRRKKMLSDKINVTQFLIWFIESYPESIEIMKMNADYQNKFK